MNDRIEKNTATRRPRGGLGTRGGSIIEYILIAGVIALAAIQGFKQARMRENRTIAYQARIIRTLDTTNPGPDDFDDPNFGNDNTAPYCDLQGHCSGPGQCFAKGTLVAAEKGLVAIETLNQGDLIWSRDEATGDFALRPVLHRYVTSGQAVMDLNVAAGNDNETIRATTGHPFWTPDKGWVSAVELAVNENLFSASGDAVHIAPIAHPALAYETVYNLEIAEFHTYFVGRHGVWVHNALPPCQQQGTLAFANASGIPLGGSWGQINTARSNYNKANGYDPKKDEGIGGEIHHMPAQSIYDPANWPPGTKPPFTPYTGPSIWMEEKDHQLTASWGKTKDAAIHREEELDLLKKGDVCGAVAIGVKDVRELFENKYDSGIKQMYDYLRTKGYDCADPG
jgi:hypothetical protein